MILYVFHINLFCDYILNVAHKSLSYKNLPGCLENKRKIKHYWNDTILSVNLLHFCLSGKEHWLF